MQSLVCITENVLFVVRRSFLYELDQPPVMVVNPGETFTIACKITGYSASGGGSTNWIRHSSGKPMEWIGWFHTSSSNQVTDSLKKISFSSETSSNAVILTEKNFNTEDTAVYYCALIHCATTCHRTCTKPPNHWTHFSIKHTYTLHPFYIKHLMT